VLAGIGLWFIASGHTGQLLSIGSDVVIGYNILAMLLLLVLWGVGRQRIRTRHDASQVASGDGSTSVHQRARTGMYSMLIAAGAITAIQSWQAERAEELRLFDAEAFNLAGSQRWLSQRAGRLAASFLASGGHQDDVSSELSSVLDQARRDRRRLEKLLADLEEAQASGPGGLGAAIETWRLESERLWGRVHELLPLLAGGPSEHASALAAAVEKHSDQALAAAQALVTASGAAVRHRQERMNSSARMWAYLNLALLAALAIVVAEPLARSIRQQHRGFARQSIELRRLALVARLTTNAVIITDARRRVLWTNRAFTVITGYSAGHALGQDVSALLDPLRAQRRLLAQPGREEQGMRMQILSRNRAGEDLWLDLDVRPIHDDGNAAASGFVCVATDVTARRRALADLRVAAIALNSMEAIVVTDARQRIIRVNPAFTRITGYASEEAIGQVTGRLLRSGRHDEAFYREMWDSLRRERYWQGEVWNQRKSGEVYPQWLSITVVTDDDGDVTNYVAVFSDISQQKAADETIHRLAYYDPLTELPNRRLLRARLQQAISAGKESMRFGALFFIDFDNFKELNDTKGHEFGDLLLVEMARRLQSGVRSHDTVARHGGDEFVIVLASVGDDAQEAVANAGSVAESIRGLLSTPFYLQDLEFCGSCSIGVTLFGGEEAPADELLRRADAAMYEAKRAGRNTVRFFDPVSRARIEARLQIEADLRRAVHGNQLRLYCQPQVDAARRIIGAEALLRWEHPERGQVSPGEFIPVAEQSDLILEIGDWVLECACRQLAAWSHRAGLSGLRLSINVSARQFRQPDFVQRVQCALERSHVAPGRVRLELTESLVLVNIEDTVAKMRELRALGVGLSMDDFGTGHSSLAYLSRLPLDELKIDQSFVQQVETSRRDAVLVQTIIGMARNLEIDVVAEGVETERQFEFLRRNGCTKYQGFLFGRPGPIDGLASETGGS